MFEDTKRVEEVNKMAQAARDYAHTAPCDLTTALAKVADENELNPNEVELVCHRLNHMVWEEKRAVDKLSVFKAAKHQEALEIANSPDIIEKQATIESEQIFILSDSDDDVEIAKIAEDQSGEDVVNQLLEDRGIVYSAAQDNVNTLNDTVYEQRGQSAEIYNTIKKLIQEGDKPEDVYEVLAKTWGEQNQGELKREFPVIIEQLKSEGVLAPEYEYTNPEDFEIREVDDTELAKQARELEEIGDRLIKTSLVHEKILDTLRRSGGGMMVEGIRKKAKIDTQAFIFNMLSDPEKVASSSAAGAASGIAQGAAKKAPGFMNSLFSTIGGQMKTPQAIMTAALTVGTLAANVITDEVRSRRVKQQLLNEYPQLARMDADLYDKLFEDIITLDPSLAKTPYYLAQILLKHDAYGTIDTSTVGELLKAKMMKADSSPMAGALKSLDTAYKVRKVMEPFKVVKGNN